MAFDTLIRNGTVIDGTGRLRCVADVGISRDKIEAIGRLENAEAVRTVDATASQGRTRRSSFGAEGSLFWVGAFASASTLVPRSSLKGSVIFALYGSKMSSGGSPGLAM